MKSLIVLLYRTTKKKGMFKINIFAYLDYILCPVRNKAKEGDELKKKENCEQTLTLFCLIGNNRTIFNNCLLFRVCRGFLKGNNTILSLSMELKKKLNCHTTFI